MGYPQYISDIIIFIISIIVFTFALTTLIILLALLGVFIWQLYTPGSALRKWNCKRGHLKPLRTGTFFFIPYTRPYDVRKSIYL